MGLHKMIEKPEILWDLFQKYKEWVDHNPIKIEDYVGKDANRVMREKPRPYIMEGFENFVADIDGMPNSLEQYFSNKESRYDDFVAICSRIRREIRSNQIAGGMAGIFNPSITQRLNSLVERSETKVDAKIENIDYSKLSESALEEIANAKSESS